MLIFGFGCSTGNSRSPSSGEPAAFAPPSQLTAELTNDDSIVLHWKNNSTADGGNWVEFATPGSQYVQLKAFLSDANSTSFAHRRVAPVTTFVYHIQPFFGRTSQPVAITTGVPTNNAPVLGEGPITSTNANPSAEKPRQYSLRSMRTFAQAGPRDLKATLSSPTSVDLHWQDCASDEDGYLVEIAPEATGKFQICALLPPDTTSFRQTGLPPKTKCLFRVRAYFNGRPSETASVTTPAR